MQYPRKTTLINSILLSIFFPLVAGLSLIFSYPDWRLNHHPLHAFLESVGAFSALTLSILMIILIRKQNLPRQFLWASCALISMGLLDGFHAVLHASNLFVWLHSIATLFGGVLFSLVWLPKGLLPSRHHGWFIAMIGLVATIVGTISLLVPELVPRMVDNGKFTTEAVFINYTGGFGFLAGSLFFIRKYLQADHASHAHALHENLVFANHCLLFGVAALLFEFSSLWDAAWWWWHLLRLAAYLIVLFYFFAFYKQDQDMLQEREGRIRLLLQSTGQGIYGVDNQGNISFVNNACIKLFGAAGEHELLHKNIHQLVHHSHPDGSPYPVETCRLHHSRLKGRQISLDDEVFWRLDGTSFPVECSSYPIINDGEIIGSVVTFSDITERKQHEKTLHELNRTLEQKVAERTHDLENAKTVAENASKAKSEFLSRMSHELRTPMNAIMGFSQLLELDDITPSQKENISEILKAGHHLLELINEVLDLAKIEEGKMEIVLKSVALEPVLHDCIELMRPLARQKDISIFLKPDDIRISSIHLASDELRLRQILLNLISNAIKYNRQGGTVTLKTELIEPQRLGICVEDTGFGIPEDKLSKVFEGFERLGYENSAVEGTGIGLVICKKLLDLMDGNLTVHSSPQGSRFCFDLACTEYGSEPGMAAASDQAKPAVIDYATRILYIEDNPSNLKLVEKMLTRFNKIRLIAAQHPRLGIELASSSRPNLILLDIQMPEMNGYEVLAALRAMDGTRDIPVVAITADAMNEDIKRGLAAGFDDYLTKPIDINRLSDVINRFIYLTG